jgi:hypothetical protein
VQPPDLNWIANFIWGIADDVLRDLYVRGKYRDVILPMTVLRRLDAVLEPNKQAVFSTKFPTSPIVRVESGSCPLPGSTCRSIRRLCIKRAGNSNRG